MLYHLARSQLALDLTAAVAAREGIGQARKLGYPIPPLAYVLASGGTLSKAQFKQLRKHFEENPWVKRPEPPSPDFIEYLCWGSAGAEDWVRSVS